MTKEEFERNWLHNKKTFEEYEKENLKYDVWQYYRMHLDIERALEVVEQKLQKSRITSKEDRKNRPYLLGFKELLNNLLIDMEKDKYLVIDHMYAQNRKSDLLDLKRLIGDNDNRMIASSLALCDYTSASRRSPEEVLDEFPYIDYLKEHKEYKEIEKNNTRRK